MTKDETPAPDSTAVATGESRISYGQLPRVLGYHLRRTQVAMFKHFARTVAVEDDISPGLFGMLQVIAANPGLAQSRLAEAMDVDRSAIVKVVTRLEERGLVVRNPSPTDRRSYCLELTRRGRDLVERMMERMMEHERQFTDVLTAEERNTLIQLLEKLYRQERE